MRNTIIFALLMLGLKLHSSEFSWTAEDGLVSSSIRLPLESLQSCIDKYFSLTETKSYDVHILLTRHLSDGDIQVSPGRHALRIYLPNSPSCLSSRAVSLRIASLLIVNRIFPEAILNSDRLPEWISSGFLFCASDKMSKRILKLPNYPISRSLYCSGWDLDYCVFFTGAISSGVPSALMNELGWILLNYFSKPNLKADFLSKLKAYLMFEKPGSPEAALLAKKCIPDDFKNIILVRSMNCFYPTDPKICQRDMAIILSDALATFKKLCDDKKLDDSTRQERFSALFADMVVELNLLRFRTTYHAQMDLAEIASNLQKMSSSGKYDKCISLLEHVAPEKIFSKDIEISEKLSDLELRYVDLGKRYSILLDHIAAYEPHAEKEIFSR